MQVDDTEKWWGEMQRKWECKQRKGKEIYREKIYRQRMT